MSTDPALMTYQPRFMYVDPQFYDLVKADVAAWKNPGPMIGQPAASVVEQFLILENRLVDSDRFEEWLDLFALECQYLIPVTDRPDGDWWGSNAWMANRWDRHLYGEARP